LAIRRDQLRLCQGCGGQMHCIWPP
jgi:hypothetical protein